jgi:sigma-B regulation protein RsbU (phosphoserine phosphatase)
VSLSDEALAVLDKAPCGLMQTSDDGVFRRVNRVFASWLGYEGSELLGRRFQDLLTMGSRIFHQTHWSPLLRMQGSLSEVKLELVHHDGTTMPMVLNAIRREEDGTFVHELAAYVARDRDRYEQELVLSRKRLESSVAEANQLHALANDRAQFAEQMIGIVSHDLRGPLATISMAAELVLDEELEGRTRLVGQINRAVDRANRLILDLLDFTQARVGSGLTVAIAKADPHAAVADLLEGLQVAHPKHTFVHERRGDGTCPLDVDRLGQAVGNLVANAIAYGRPGTPVTVTTSVDRTGCSVAVHNDGDPIAPEILAAMFQPMTRGTTTVSRSRSVGLGLFIVNEIAKAHGGSASVRSAAGEGTTMTVVFPRPARDSRPSSP